MEEYVDLLSKLQEDYQSLEDIRSSTIKEHERIFNSSERVRLLILQQEEIILNKIEEELCEQKRQLKTLQESNQTNLQGGISKIDQKQEQILLLCSKLKTLINSEGKHTGGREIQDQIAKMFSKEKSFNITLKKPQFVPRLHQGLKLGEIVSEEKSLQFSFSSLYQGTELRGHSVLKHKVKAENATSSKNSDINSTTPGQNPGSNSRSQSYDLAGDPSSTQGGLNVFLQDSMEGQVDGRGTDGEILSEEGMVLLENSLPCSYMLTSGNKTSLRVSECQIVSSPNPENCCTVGSKVPESEDCGRYTSSVFTEKVNVSASWLDGGCVPHMSPNGLDKLEMFEERASGVPFKMSALCIQGDFSMNQDTALPALRSSQCISDQNLSLPNPNKNDQRMEPLAEACSHSLMTPNYNVQTRGSQQQFDNLCSVMKKKPGPTLGSQATSSPGNAQEESATPMQTTICVITRDLPNTVSQVRNSAVTDRNKANQLNPTHQLDCLGGDSTFSSSQTETSQPIDPESIFRVTTAFISDEDSEDSVSEDCAVTDVKAQIPELYRAQAICASHVPSASQGNSDHKMSRWTSMNSIREAPAQLDSGNIAAGDSRSSAMNKRFKKKMFSKSCLDLTANGRPVIPELRIFSDPEEDKLEKLLQRMSSPTESLDSSNTFLIDSPRDFEESKKIPSGTLKVQSPSKPVQHQAKGKYRSHFTKTIRSEANKKGSSQIVNAKERCPSPTRRLRTSLSSSSSISNREEHPSLIVDNIESLGQHRMSRTYSSELGGQMSRFKPKVTRKPQVPFQEDRKVLKSKVSQSNYGRFLSASCIGTSAEMGGWMTENPNSSLVTTKARSKSEANLSCQVQRATPFFKNDLVGQFGKYGCGRSDLNLPYGIHITPKGTMYVVDYGNKRLQAMNRKGDVIQQVGLQRSAYFDISVNTQGLLALSNISNKSVDVYSRHGKLLSIITEDFQNPRGITVNNCDQYLITDTKQGTISVLTLDPHTAQRLDNIVVPGFNKPYFISINSSGHVAVSERGFDGGCCVKILDRNLQVLSVLGSSKSSLTIELSNPWGVCIDDQDNVLVVDWRHRHSIILYPPQGPASIIVDGGLSSPRGLALVHGGHIAVTDTMHNCIKVFRYR
ncbi:uncharacterized protein [Scyliorhinus torazame]|uniref:uncharacterized protein n=1 Tax=Scyliorhinus torazame TaxID=75743 RepID=UPI003B5A925D